MKEFMTKTKGFESSASETKKMQSSEYSELICLLQYSYILSWKGIHPYSLSR